MRSESAFTALVLLGLVAVRVAPERGAAKKAVVQAHAPVWITASWSAGAQGPPIDRVDREPNAGSVRGRLCPASRLELRNWSGGTSLSFSSRCAVTYTVFVCATKGSDPQPAGGLEPCAPDPLDTPLDRLTKVEVDSDPQLAVVLPFTRILSIQVFYCDSETVLSGPPLRCS